MGAYAVASRDEATNWMAEYPDFGEMLSYTDVLGCDAVALTWRRMPAETGGKGSYGHRHKDQEEIYFVIRGKVQFKLGRGRVRGGPADRGSRPDRRLPLGPQRRARGGGADHLLSQGHRGLRRDREDRHGLLARRLTRELAGAGDAGGLQDSAT